ncbi:hypothetical protein GCM10020331_013800 [Ectobacillus funiculus]
MVMHGTNQKKCPFKKYIEIRTWIRTSQFYPKNHDAFLLIDLQGKVEYASHACEPLLGYSGDPLQQLTLHKLFISDFF